MPAIGSERADEMLPLVLPEVRTISVQSGVLWIECVSALLLISTRPSSTSRNSILKTLRHAMKDTYNLKHTPLESMCYITPCLSVFKMELRDIEYGVVEIYENALTHS